MIEPNGGMSNLIVALSGIAISMVIAFVLTMVLYKDEESKEVKEVKNEVKEETKKVKSSKLEKK